MTSNKESQESIEQYADGKLQEAHMKYLREKYQNVFQEYYDTDHETAKALHSLQKTTLKLRREVDLALTNNVMNFKQLEKANHDAQEAINNGKKLNNSLDREIDEELRPSGWISLILSVLAFISLFVVIFVKI